MRTPRTLLCVVILVALSMSIVACSSPSPAPPAPTAAPKPAAGEPAKSAAPTAAAPAAPAKPAEPAKAAEPAKPAAAAPTGKLSIAMSSDVNTLDLNNLQFTVEQAMLGNTIGEALVRYDETGKPIGVLAESWTNPSQTEWDFKLRRGVKFHNGEPLNAEAVKFNADRSVEPNKGRNPRVQGAIAGATVIDEYTVRLKTPKPDPLFLDNMRNMLILPPKYGKEAGDQAVATKPVGTGPFKFVEWVKGDHLTMEANPDYWGGPPKVKTLNYRIIPEIATRVAALKAGEVDVVAQLTPDQFNSIKQSANLDVVGVSAPRVSQIGLNVLDPKGAPLKDVRVRQALSYAINVQALIDTILGGQGKRVATLAPPQAFGFDPSVEPYPYDANKAKQLLADAGYPNGFEFEITVPTGGSLLKPLEVAQVVVADWAKVGVRVRIRSVETGTFTKERDEKKLTAAFLWNWIAFDADRMIWANMHSKSPWSYNPLLPGDNKLDALIDEEQSTVDQNKRKENLAKLQRTIRDEALTIIMYQQNDLYGISKRVKDMKFMPSGEFVVLNASVQ